MPGRGGILRPVPPGPREAPFPKGTSLPLSRAAADWSEMVALSLLLESGKDLVSSESWSKDQWAMTSAARSVGVARSKQQVASRRGERRWLSFMVGTSGD